MHGKPVALQMAANLQSSPHLAFGSIRLSLSLPAMFALRLQSLSGMQLVLKTICTHLQHALEQVALATREATPVGQDDEGQGLLVKLLYGVCGLLCAVGIPNLA